MANFLIPPVVLAIEPLSGEMAGRTGTKLSRVGDLRGLYFDNAAFDRLAAKCGMEVAYEVHEFRPERVAPYELVFGTSIVQPGKVGAEFFMTRGHVHVLANRPEIYLCQRGRGVMHMEAPDGTTRPIEMIPGTLVYVPPYWIHRSVNIGPEPFITLFCYPADAGQDYGIIERAQGMRTLIVDDGSGSWSETVNQRYRPRSPRDQQRLLAEAEAA